MQFWHDFLSDLHLALRQARRRPAFSLTLISVLALGLGANTAIFSALYSSVFKPLPYADPAALVVVHNRYPQLHLDRLGASVLDYLDLRQHHDLFSETGVYYFLDLSRTGIERPEKVNAVAVTASLLDTLGVAPLMGRNFDSQEEGYRGPRAVILSEGYWKRAFGRDAGILERSIKLDGELYRIVGIMPESFHFPNPVTEMWVPVTFSPKSMERTGKRAVFLRMVARLASGLDVQQASARIEQLSRQVSLENAEQHPFDQGWRYFVLPLARDDDGSSRRWLYLLFAAVTGLLLIVCSNVAGLLLVRATERRFDLALRMALGASRWRVARQVVTEVLVLSVAGGVAALWISQTSVTLLSKYGSVGDPHLETPVYIFLFALSVFTGLVCGIYPAWMAARNSVGHSIKEGGHQRTAGGRQQRFRQALIVGQVAIAATLLICGGLLTRSLIRLLEIPTGFDARNVLTMETTLPRTRYVAPEAWNRFFAAAIEQIAQVPGIEAASGCTLLPFGYGENVNTFHVLGRPKPPVDQFALLNNIDSNYFKTMRIPLIRGRVFTRQDVAGSQPVTIIDDTMARLYFSGQDPIGRQIQMPWDKPFTIVGVVSGVKTSALEVEVRPTLYFSFAQYPNSSLSIVVRSYQPEQATTDAVRRIVAGIDKDQPVYDVSALATRIDKSLATRRLVVWLIVLFAAGGTLLAALGLYGLLSYTIALRRRELGIRIVLGADAREMGTLIARRGGLMVGGGLAIGAIGAIAAQRVIASQLYGVTIWDGLTWISVVATLGISCAAACAIPAWRASTIDPLEALRDE